MKITKTDLENYRYDKKQAELYDDQAEKARLKKVLDYVRHNTRGMTRIVVLERYFSGDGKSRFGIWQETWSEIAQRIGVSEGYCKTLCSEFLHSLDS